MMRDIKNLKSKFEGKASGAYRDIKRKIKDFEQSYEDFKGQEPRNYDSSDYRKFLKKFEEIFDATKQTNIDSQTFTQNNLPLEETRIANLIKPYLKQRLRNKRRTL